MSGPVATFRRRLQLMGFEGPAYRGTRGKLRFVLESTLWREELVFVATPESFAAVSPPAEPRLELIALERYEDVEPFRAELEEHYYAGYTERWRGPFEWGERAVIGRLDGRVACYNFFQEGHERGHPTYWGRLLADDARVLRGAVLPAFRRLGLNRVMKWRLLQRFFEQGRRRVYGECYSNNLPSIRTLVGVGFVAIGKLKVLEIAPLRNFVRWEPLD